MRARAEAAEAELSTIKEARKEKRITF